MWFDLRDGCCGGCDCYGVCSFGCYGWVVYGYLGVDGDSYGLLVCCFMVCIVYVWFVIMEGWNVLWIYDVGILWVSDIGKEVIFVGWVGYCCDYGGVVFIDFCDVLGLV